MPAPPLSKHGLFRQAEQLPFVQQLLDPGAAIQAGHIEGGRAGMAMMNGFARQRNAAQMTHVSGALGISRSEAYGLDALYGLENIGLADASTGALLLDDAKVVREVANRVHGTRPGTPRLLDEVHARRRSNVGVITGPAPMHIIPQILDELALRGVADPFWYKVGNLRVVDAADGTRQLLHRGRPVPMPDGVIARVKGKDGLRLVRQLEDDGVHMANRSPARKASNKTTTARLLKETGLPHPDTTILDDMVRPAEQWRAAAREYGYPVVFKHEHGAGGSGVWVVRSEQELDDLIRERSAIPGHLAQRFIPRAPGTRATDLRVMMVRDADGRPQIRTVYQRWAPEGSDKAVDAHFTMERWPSRGVVLRPRVGEHGVQVPATAGAASDAMRFTPHEERMLGEALDATQGDAIGIDLMFLPEPRMWKGKPVRFGVIEFNTVPTMPEMDMPFPYAEHAAPAIADYLVYGRAPALRQSHALGVSG